MKRVLVPLAEGFKEIEAVTIVDVLRRAGIGAARAAPGLALAPAGELAGHDARAAVEARLQRPGRS